MKTAPSTVLDLALSCFSSAYCHYHVLPKCQLDGFDQVNTVLENSAAKHTKKYRKVQVLFINGVDTLAKCNEKMCCALITWAKVLANSNKLKIVLVSSKGTVMPLLTLLSTVNKAMVYEIGDIEKEKAIQYLMKMGIMKDGANEVVNCVGGRLVYLQSSMKIVGSISNTNHICTNIKTQFYFRKLSSQEASVIPSELKELCIVVS